MLLKYQDRLDKEKELKLPKEEIEHLEGIVNFNYKGHLIYSLSITPPLHSATVGNCT